MSDAIAEMTAYNVETKGKSGVTARRRAEFSRIILKHACKSLGETVPARSDPFPIV